MHRFSPLYWLTLAAVACGSPPATPPGPSADTPSDAQQTGSTPNVDPSEILAEVDGVQVTKREFQIRARRQPPANGTALSDEERKQVLDDLLDEKILYLVAREKGFDSDPRVQRLMVQTLLRKEVYQNDPSLRPTPEELQAYYDEHREEFILPEKVQVSRIFIAINDSRDAEQAKELIDGFAAEIAEDDNAFARIAAKHSEHPSRVRGGDLGYLTREGRKGLDATIVDTAFELQEGGVSEVFEAEDGLNLLRVTDRRERIERPFNEVRGAVLRKVKNEKVKAVKAEYVAGFRNKYSVKRFDDRLADIELGATNPMHGRGFPRGHGRPGPGGPRPGMARPKPMPMPAPNPPATAPAEPVAPAAPAPAASE